MFTWLINGVDLTEFGVQRSSVYRPPVQGREAGVTIPGIHGQTFNPIPVFDAPTVTLHFRMWETQQETLEAKADRFTRLLASPHIMLGREKADSPRVEAPAVLQSLMPGPYFPGSYAEYTAELLLPGVFFTDIQDSTAAITEGTSVLGALSGGTAPISGLQILARGPLQRLTITSQGGQGEAIIWTGTLPQNTALTIDCATLTATSEGTISAVNVTYPPAGPLVLYPHPITGRVTVDTHIVGGNANTRVELRGRRAWL